MSPVSLQSAPGYTHRVTRLVFLPRSPVSAQRAASECQLPVNPIQIAAADVCVTLWSSEAELRLKSRVVALPPGVMADVHGSRYRPSLALTMYHGDQCSHFFSLLTLNSGWWPCPNYTQLPITLVLAKNVFPKGNTPEAIAVPLLPNQNQNAARLKMAIRPCRGG